MPDRPLATFRIQLNTDFRLEHARSLIPFLAGMGVSHVYLSPVFKARPGSMHGYDVVDPSVVNPEVGGEAEFDALVAALKAEGMGVLLDIVPNHMAASSDNAWWMDVLESGTASAYAGFFDVEWAPRQETIEDKIFLPILGSPYGAALENQEIRLAIDAAGFYVTYYSTRLPIDPSTYGVILEHRADERPQSEAFEELLEMIRRLPDQTTKIWEGIEGRRREIPAIKTRLWELYENDGLVRAFIDANISIFNGRQGDSRSFDLLDDLLGRQAYRMSWWQVARERMNYRRFFDVSELIGIRQENERVFAATHSAVARWVTEGKVQGLRVDHIDGLQQPQLYLERLASLAAPRPYIVVEKILLGEERLSESWPVDGTTGYDFLNIVNGVLVDGRNMPALGQIYAEFTGLTWSFEQAAYEQKRWILRHLFRGEFSALGLHLALIAEADRYGRDISPAGLRRALVETTARLPVYRTYLAAGPTPCDRDYIERAISGARESSANVSQAAFDFLRHVLLLEFPPTLGEAGRLSWQEFVMRWQQLTGPVTAKGVEDTALYLFNRLISLNEVGSDAEAVPLERFHQFNAIRRRWPATMNATSTHDTKRSEDVRARISVLSEIPDEWRRWLRRWSRWNRDKKKVIDGRPVPDPNEEVLLYQTLLGSWPLNDEDEASFMERLRLYLTKATREAKVYSTWLHPNEEHERAIFQFAQAILDASSRFRPHFLEVQRRIALFGAVNSLSQTLIKITAPGAPDFYQNTFFWDYSLVDPDNRRPIDVEGRLRLLDEIRTWTRPGCARELLASWKDGRVKAFTSYQALQYRKANHELFMEGEYKPVEAQGARAPHVLAFARELDGRACITVVPRFAAEFSGRSFPVGRRPWGDTTLVLPDQFSEWRNIITGESGAGAALSDILLTFPVALLELA
jgi:(1->4)-alpha-D-glucan 1-alpha-D-glucosylmutase